MRKLKKEKGTIPKKERNSRSTVKFKGSIGGFFRNRIVIGSICVIFAVLVAFVGLPFMQSYVSQRVPIVIAACDIKVGTWVTPDMLKVADIGEIDRPSTAVQDISQVIGSYAASHFTAGDYIVAPKLTKEKPMAHPYLYNLPEGKRAVSVSVKGLAEGLSGKLKAGDIVSLYATDNQSGNDREYTAIQMPELRYVRVLATSNSFGNDIESENKALIVSEADGERENLPATITLQAGEEQTALLVGMDHNSTLHVSLVARGDNLALCEELLARQEKIIEDLKISSLSMAKDGALQIASLGELTATPSTIQTEKEEKVGEGNG